MPTHTPTRHSQLHSRTGLIERTAGETQLFVKEVKVEGRRSIVGRNEAEAEKDRSERQAIVAGLEQQLSRGDKALIGNSAYRRYLKRTSPERAFAIDAGKLAEEARFDGLFVLRTNAKISPLQAVLRYRDHSKWRICSGAPRRFWPRADLPLLRRGDPRPCLLLVPGPGAAEGAR